MHWRVGSDQGVEGFPGSESTWSGMRRFHIDAAHNECFIDTLVCLAEDFQIHTFSQYYSRTWL